MTAMSTTTVVRVALRSTGRRLTGGRWPRVRADEPLPCGEVARLMQRFLDGELDTDGEVRAVAVHVERCEPCGIETDVYRRIKVALRRRRRPVDDAAVDRLRACGRGLTER